MTARGASPTLLIMRIRAVFFDVGNVLLRVDPKAIALRLAWRLRRHPLLMLRFLGRSLATVDALERGRLSGERLYRIFRAELGFDGSFAEFRAVWCDHFSPLEDNVALLRALSRERRVYLLSNTNRLHFEHIQERFAFARQVHGTVLSHRLGLRKPEAGIYRAALRLADAPAEECLVIDDRLENVRSARRCGLHAIWYRAGDDLAAALRSYGLLAEAPLSGLRAVTMT